MTFEQAAIEAFRSGPIAGCELDPMGISFLSVNVAGVSVRASWYTSGPRDIMIDGRAYPGSGGAVIREAMHRAKNLLREDMAKLDALVNK